RLALEPKPDLVVQVVVISPEDAKIKKTLQSRYGLKQQLRIWPATGSGAGPTADQLAQQLRIGGWPATEDLEGWPATEDLELPATEDLERLAQQLRIWGGWAQQLRIWAVQDFSEVHSATRIRVFPAKVLGHFYRHLGPVSDAGPERPSNQRCRHLGYQPFVQRRLSKRLDVNFLLDLFRTDVAYLKSTWSAVGRPLFVIPVYHWYFNPDTAEASQTALLTTIRKLQSGYINGTRLKRRPLNYWAEGSKRTGCWRRPGPQRRTSRPLFSRGRCRLGSTASVHSRTFGSSESSPEDQCSVRTRSRRQPPSSAAASAAAAATASRRRKSLVLSNAVSEELGEDLDVTDARLRPRFVRHPCPPAAAAAATSSFDEDRQHSVDHSSPLAMAYQRLNSVCEGSGLRRTASLASRCAKPATLEHVDSGENMKRVLRHGQDRDRGHLGVGNGGLDYDTGWQEAAGPVTVRDLVKELYEKAGSLRQWCWSAFTAGMLDKRVTVGSRRAASTLINLPLASGVLAARIRAACAAIRQHLPGQGRTYAFGSWGPKWVELWDS
uniref:Phosphorylase b kinase regulatory subunit n=1 Tax=Macrostomum lignano TaxID=282301 RepID=A0A1I8FME7_9PLAT